MDSIVTDIHMTVVNCVVFNRRIVVTHLKWDQIEKNIKNMKNSV